MRFKQITGAVALLAACLLTSHAVTQAQPAPSPTRAERAELWNTEQFVFRSTILGRDMLIQVVKPLSPPQGRIPAVYMVDGNVYTSFAINPMVGAFTGEYAPAYFIGVGYPEQSPLQWARQRATDLLHQPNVDLAGPDYPYMEGVQSGGGALFQRFLKEELRPLVEGRYAIDSNRTVLAGISYGGLFTTRVMLDDPTAFSAYLIGSPSLDVEPSLVARARTVQLRRGTQVFVSAGGAEEAEHLAFTRALAAALRANPSGATVTEWIVPEEGHVGFAPAFFGRALATVLPATSLTR